ncbi:MAG: phosphate ABC transporter substrate-binding protein PstS [Candidatus Eisenbacteria bacterium]|nr:phosphate ABC transporter substrate-binding protein PstS [Candidatus Eisenbacteria bacterium]
MGLTLVAAMLTCIAGAAIAAPTINGAGATFPEPIYALWMNKYYELTGVKINYQGIGSSGGIRQIEAGTVDFGGSDAPMRAAALVESGLIQFPMVVGGVVPIVNIEGIAPGELRLSPQALADMFAGEIVYWDNDAIRELNPELELPHQAVTVVHRAEGSGTTWIFTNYLDKVSPMWHEKFGTGKTVAWPVGVGAKGNPGVAAYVQRVAGSIGYVEYAYAVQNKLPHVSLRNAAGEFVQPTIESFQAAAANADWASAKGYYMVLTDQPGEETWPIVGATFILLHKKMENPRTARAMLKFFDWCYDHGSEMAVEKDYVPIPGNVVEMIQESWEKELRANGQQIWPLAAEK